MRPRWSFLLVLALLTRPAWATVELAAVELDRLTRELTVTLPDDRTYTIGIGRFEVSPEGVETAWLADRASELAAALAKIPRVRVVSRERLNELELDGAFHQPDPLAPRTQSRPASLDGIDFILRGTVREHDDGYVLEVDLVRLDGNGRHHASTTVAGARSAAADATSFAAPIESRKTIQEVDAFVASLPQDFDVELLTSDGRRHYQVGEFIDYSVRTSRRAHVAVLCHQHDGATVVLLPNRYDSDLAFPADKLVPLDRNGGFRIQASTPGVDVVQVLACVEEAPVARFLHRFGEYASGPDGGPFLPSLDRSTTMSAWLAAESIRSEDRCATRAIRINIAPKAASAPTPGGDHDDGAGHKDNLITVKAQVNVTTPATSIFPSGSQLILTGLAVLCAFLRWLVT